MKKLVVFTVLVVMALTLMGGFAFAGGWTKITNNVGIGYPNGVSGTTTNSATWDVTSSGTPHLGFSSTTNQCRVCHAVHNANPADAGLSGSSWRLLRGTGKATECDVCHGANGITAARPYGKKSYTVLGEHTLTNGNISIPDSTQTTWTVLPNFGCNNCHSVHGAGTLATLGGLDPSTAAALNAPTTGWANFILKTDPYISDGVPLGQGLPGVVGNGTSSIDQIKTGFCSSCHRDNPNWNSADTTPYRANPLSHVQGTAADGQLEVDGVTKTVAWKTANGANASADTGCMGCHSASDAGNVLGSGATSATASAFPHQTASDKLLSDYVRNGTVDVSGTVGDADRVIPSMDEVCGTCHTNSGDFSVSATQGVGRTF